MEHQDKIEFMLRWAHKHKAHLTLEGECGIGRECVGILVNDIYPDYEWHDGDYNRADDNGEIWTPPDAYHKHPCVAVLGRGVDAEDQLYQWVKWFNKNGFTIETGDNPKEEWEKLGVVGILLGKNRYARMVRKGVEPITQLKKSDGRVIEL